MRFLLCSTEDRVTHSDHAKSMGFHQPHTVVQNFRLLCLMQLFDTRMAFPYVLEVSLTRFDDGLSMGIKEKE